MSFRTHGLHEASDQAGGEKVPGAAVERRGLGILTDPAVTGLMLADARARATIGRTATRARSNLGK
jgi:hypothetical protein